MFVKSLLGTVAAFALASAAQAAVNVSVWTGVPTTVSQNATLAQAGTLGTANGTTTVGGFNFATSDSTATTVGAWLGNPAGLDPTAAAHALNDAYFLFTGSIFLNAGTNSFTVAHDDGLQLNVDGIGLVVDAPGPSSPATLGFDILAPSAGTYNFQLSYGECCGGPAVLQFLYPTGQAVGGDPVPEPATWAMMLIGFGGIGMTMRARRRRSSTIPQIA
jgi:hypothetical protein